ncbi:MAG TPA: signal peptidase II [Pirellulales bacterium]|nr:signal peptidase II [Pirellulales bacterium]
MLKTDTLNTDTFTAAGHPGRQAMTTIPKRRYAVFFLLAAGGCAADLLTKSWIFASLGMPGERPTFWLLPNIFGFTTSLNEGALFGFGQGQVKFFSVLSIVAALGILYWLFFLGAARDALLTFAMGCVMAGILGNLYDRVGLPGLRWNGAPIYAVRDWLHFKVNAIGLDWPIFNIADSLLVCGAGLLMWHAWRSESPAMNEVRQQPDVSDAA